MDTLVVLTALQHPMDPAPEYAPETTEAELDERRRQRRRTLPHLAPGKRARLHQPRPSVRLEDRCHDIASLSPPAHKRPETAVYRRHHPAGEPWLMEVKAGQTLRILDLEGNQAVDTLFYSVANPETLRRAARCAGRTAST